MSFMTYDHCQRCGRLIDPIEGVCYYCDVKEYDH
jgi:RNA polymerase subunit RPABC4/transcription elongation factor Spt4